MSTTVALLRGVNVGGRNRLAMGDLVALFESLGLRDVRTYIQSGNVLFSGGRGVTAERLSAAIGQRFGLSAAVVLRRADELARVVPANPFASSAPETLHVGFLERAPAPSVTASLDPNGWAPEEFALVGTEVYLRLPNGMGRAKLPSALERSLKTAITFRNWRTLRTLAELAASP